MRYQKTPIRLDRLAKRRQKLGGILQTLHLLAPRLKS
jgi:hypothetical protein